MENRFPLLQGRRILKKERLSIIFLFYHLFLLSLLFCYFQQFLSKKCLFCNQLLIAYNIHIGFFLLLYLSLLHIHICIVHNFRF